jgi:dihydroflavonol-4-reductase
MRALVTGGTGFIGARLVARLLESNHEVVVLARNESEQLPDGARLFRGDVTDPDTLGDAGVGCNRLYHLAAFITFDPREKGKLSRVNGEGTANVLAAAKRWGVERCVVASSACTLGISRAAGDVLDEEAVPPARVVARNPYLASKLACEQAAMAASAEQFVTIVAPTTVYGPGDWTLNSGVLVRQVATSRVVPLPPGGSNVVDVDDVVAGILAAGERGCNGRRYVLGGANLPFKEIVATICDVVGCRPVKVPLPRLLQGPAMLAAWAVGRLSGSRFITTQIIGDLFAFKYYSSARTEAELGWTARVPFRQSVERAWRFYRDEGLI